MDFDKTIFINLSISYSISVLIIVIYSFYINYCLFNKMFEIVNNIKNCEIVIQEYSESDEEDDYEREKQNIKSICESKEIEDYEFDDDTDSSDSEHELDNIKEDKKSNKNNNENIKSDTETNVKIIDDEEDLMINNDDFINILHNLVSTISKSTDSDKNNDKNNHLDKSES